MNRADLRGNWGGITVPTQAVVQGGLPGGSCWCLLLNLKCKFIWGAFWCRLHHLSKICSEKVGSVCGQGVDSTTTLRVDAETVIWIQELVSFFKWSGMLQMTFMCPQTAGEGFRLSSDPGQTLNLVSSRRVHGSAESVVTAGALKS